MKTERSLPGSSIPKIKRCWPMSHLPKSVTLPLPFVLGHDIPHICVDPHLPIPQDQVFPGPLNGSHIFRSHVSKGKTPEKTFAKYLPAHFRDLHSCLKAYRDSFIMEIRKLYLSGQCNRQASDWDVGSRGLYLLYTQEERGALLLQTHVPLPLCHILLNQYRQRFRGAIDRLLH